MDAVRGVYLFNMYIMEVLVSDAEVQFQYNTLLIYDNTLLQYQQKLWNFLKVECKAELLYWIAVL